MNKLTFWRLVGDLGSHLQQPDGELRVRLRRYEQPIHTYIYVHTVIPWTIYIHTYIQRLYRKSGLQLLSGCLKRNSRSSNESTKSRPKWQFCSNTWAMYVCMYIYTYVQYECSSALTHDPMEVAVLMALNATTSWPSPILTHSISFRFRRARVSMESVGSAPSPNRYAYIHYKMHEYVHTSTSLCNMCIYIRRHTQSMAVYLRRAGI